MPAKPEQLLQWGIVGLGIGEQHARKLITLPNCHLRCLCDHDQAKAQRLATELGGRQIVQTFEQMLGDPTLDAVIIASFDNDHFAQVLAALNAGKHVFVEKPLCRTVDELAAIKAAWMAHDGKIKLSSNLILRAAPIYRWLKAQINCGAMGRIYSFDGEYLYGRLNKIIDGWRKDVENYSVMLGGGIHLIDLMLWLTGERPESVMALGNQISTEGSNFRYSDFVAASYAFPSGMVGRICANFGCVHPHQHVVRTYGTKATFLYDDAGPRWHTSRDPQQAPEKLNLATLPAHKGDLISGFASAILQDTDLSHHTQTIFDAISLCAAADDALKQNQPVRITYL